MAYARIRELEKKQRKGEDSFEGSGLKENESIGKEEKDEEARAEEIRWEEIEKRLRMLLSSQIVGNMEHREEINTSITKLCELEIIV